MQTQSSPKKQPAPASKPTANAAKPAGLVRAPIALDAKDLRKVSGAGGEGPYKGW